jgi:hypothetical protein
MFSAIKPTKMIWAGAHGAFGNHDICLKILNGKDEGESLLGRPRHRWEDTKMDRTRIGRVGMGWIHFCEI